MCTSLAVGVAFTTWLLPTKRDISAAVKIIPIEDRIEEVQYFFSIDSNARLAQEISENATAGAEVKVVFENDAVTI